jgi:chromosome segregation ATPase
LSEQYLELDRREQLLQAQLTQFENERRQFRLLASQRELELSEREGTVERERSDLEQRQQQVTATEASQHELQLALLRERRDLQEEREQFAGDQAAIRAALADEVEATHARLDRERDEAAADCARIREELQRDQQLSESRLRFREEHLQRTMREFEQQQHEFRVEQQQGRTRLAETESQLLLRRQQLAGIRAGLETQTASLDRDRQWLQVERRGLEARLQQDRERLRTEQHDWNATRAEQLADIERKQEQLRVHAAALETRRQQLETLRQEFEQNHAEVLELRLAVEESYAQLTRTVGEETTFERVEEARRLLAEHYRNSRDTLAIQRQELEQLQARLTGERNDLLFERQTLAEWVTAQEQLLGQRAVELDHDRAALQNREVAWRHAEDRWHSERQQAETIIRELLRERDGMSGTSSRPG